MRIHPLATLAAAAISIPLSTLGVRAQLAAYGPSGVVMGHLHLTAADAAASRTFWTSLGAAAVQNGNLQLLQLPGTFVMVRQGQPSGGSTGSTTDHVTFRVRDAAGWAKSAGVAIENGSVTAPDGIVVHVIGDPALASPSRMESISIATAAPDEAQAWYVKQFGATTAKAGALGVADLPGVRLEFVRAAAAPAPTKGRALDHIGFEVRNLEDFCKKLEASGQKLDRPFTRLPNSATAIAFLTDPWGTYIELTENLAPPK
jgi:catechol 2,3-dioxygenase-like lactoylglutathione lyase family enzyme